MPKDLILQKIMKIQNPRESLHVLFSIIADVTGLETMKMPLQLTNTFVLLVLQIRVNFIGIR